jgi:hypothetical protein
MQKLGLPGRTGSLNKNTELSALNEIIKKLVTLNNSVSSGAGSGTGSTLAEQLIQTTALNNIIAALPTDAATETTLDLALTTLGSILAQLDVDLSTRASEASLLATINELTDVNTTLASILQDTTNIANDFDVALSTRATEATLLSLLTELQLKADLSETQPVSLLQSNLIKLEQEADDLVKTFSYLDAGLPDERVNTIVYSSVVLALTVTKTFVYAGSSPNFRVSTITLS